MRTRKITAGVSSTGDNSRTMPVRTGICRRTSPSSLPLPLFSSSASSLNSMSKVGGGVPFPVVLVALVIVSFWYGIHQMRHRQELLTHYAVPVGLLPSITIFAAPRPFSASSGGLGTVAARQELAVRSWLALSPNISVVLFGNHPSVFSFAETLGPRVSVESAIDFTFLGTPFFHSMFARSQASNSEISVLVDAETVLLPDLITALFLAHKLDHDWLLISMSSNLSHFPFRLDNTGKHWLQEDGQQIKFEKLQELLAQRRYLRACGDRVLMAWNKGNLPLHSGVLPPFLYGKGFHNQWLINEALSSNLRLVIDASEVISSFYPESIESNQFLTGFDCVDVCDKKWEGKGNAHLAALYGSLHFKQNKFSSILIRLVKCAGHYIFTNTADSTVYSLHCADGQTCLRLNQLVNQEQESSGLLKRKFLPSIRDKWTTCVKVINSFYRSDKCSIMESSEVTVTLPAQLYLPFSLELLLQMIVDKDKSVVLAVAGDNYRDMLMSWICRLRQLSVMNFLVCALDIEMYQFSVLQGLPVFKDPLAPSNISVDGCHFGSDCFQRVTKVKSRLVLQILKLGYNVLLSDVDVYWFHNPLPFLRSLGPAVLVAQSDEYNVTGPINLPRRLNSGFYFAHSDTSTISAMEKVVKHASLSGLSEQPSFYDVLCGEGGINRVGDDRCFEPETNLTVHFLDRDLFPNGAFQGLWEKPDVKSACQKKGCLILHNNWISGRKRKLERQVLSGLWAYDASSGMCLQDWHRTRSTSYLNCC